MPTLRGGLISIGLLVPTSTLTASLDDVESLFPEPHAAKASPLRLISDAPKSAPGFDFQFMVTPFLRSRPRASATEMTVG